MVGKPLGMGAPYRSTPYTPYIVGIYWVYDLLKGSLGGFKQLRALHPKGFPTIFPMIEISCGALKKRKKCPVSHFLPPLFLRGNASA